MKKSEIIVIIDGIIESLTANPEQFSIKASIVGQQVTTHGGIGMKMNVTGGGSGSTVGNQVTLDGASIQFSQERAKEAFKDQYKSLVDVLKKISDEFKDQTPNRSKVERFVSSLRGTWVPNVITGVIANLTSAWFGIGGIN